MSNYSAKQLLSLHVSWSALIKGPWSCLKQHRNLNIEVSMPLIVQGSLWSMTEAAQYACIGEGNGNPLQYSCLENPRDRGAWWAAVYEVAQSDTTEVTQQQRQQHGAVTTEIKVNSLIHLEKLWALVSRKPQVIHLILSGSNEARNYVIQLASSF